MLTGKAPEVDTLPEQLMVTQLKIVSTARGRTWQHSFFLDLFGFCSLFVAYSLHTFVGPGHELKPSHIAIRIFSSWLPFLLINGLLPFQFHFLLVQKLICDRSRNPVLLL